MVRRLPGAILLLWATAASAQQAAAPLPVPAAASVAKQPVPKADPPAQKVTPNAERIVSIGALNKRTGLTRVFTGRPGQYFDFGALRVTVRTCETTPPWEQKLTGAFLLIDERLTKGGARRVYSGWMFAESPSLHPLEHALYDIWVKSCVMRFPETGPDTVSAGKSTPSPRSIAKKSAETPSAEAN